MDTNALNRGSLLMAGLPLELLLQIFKHENLTSNDRANTSLTCRRIQAIILPILYSLSTDLERALCLFLAAKRGHVDTLQVALDAGANINCQAWFNDKDRSWFNEQHTGFTTPLHVAAKYGQTEAAEWLLDHGADIDSPSKNWCHAPTLERYFCSSVHTWTPLFAALNEKRTSTAELLVSRGAKLVSLESSIPAIHVAAANGMNSVIRLLSEENDEVCELTGLTLPKVFDIKSHHCGIPVLHYASLYWPHDRSEDYAISSAIPLLSALGADINATNLNDEDALTHACKEGNFQAATLLVKAGANPNVENGKTRYSYRQQQPLQLACQSWATIQQESREAAQTRDESEVDAARAELIEALVAAGAAIIDPSGSEMHTVLVRFCLSHTPTTANALLRLGVVDVNSVDGGGQTALLRYLRLGSPSVCSARDLSIIRLLLDHGARLDMPDGRDLDVLQLIINWFVENSKWTTHLPIFLEHAKDANVSKTRIEAAIASLAKMIDPEALEGYQSDTSPSVVFWLGRRLRSSSSSISGAHEQSTQQARQVRAMNMLLDFWQAVWGPVMLP